MSVESQERVQIESGHSILRLRRLSIESQKRVQRESREGPGKLRRV